MRALTILCLLSVLSGCQWIAGYDRATPVEVPGEAGPSDGPIPDVDGQRMDGAAPPDAQFVSSPWARVFGPADRQIAHDVAIDAQGNVYVVGETSGQIVLDEVNTIPSANAASGFLVKLAPNGDYVWARMQKGTADLSTKAVTITSGGDVVVAGSFYGTANIGSNATTSKGATDIFVARYSPSSTALWVEYFGGPGADSAEALAPSANDQVVLAGYFIEELSGRDLSLNYPGYLQEALLLKLDAEGNYIWDAVAGGPDFDRAYAVATNTAGDIAVAGITYGGFTYNTPPTTLTNADANADLFVWRMNAAGQEQDALLVEGDINVEKLGLHLGDQQDAVLCFRYTGAPSVGGVEPLGKASDLNIGVLALDLATSSLSWATSYGGLDADTCHDLAVDSGGDVTITGYFRTSFGAGAPTVVASGPYDAYVARIDGATQTLLWVEAVEGLGTAQGHAVAIGPSGRVVVAGELKGETNFGGLAVDSPSGDTDAAVLSFQPSF